MPTEYTGEMDAAGKRFAIVAGRWHERFAETLIDGAIETLERHGAEETSVELFRCPGSFEIPQVASRVVETREVDAVVCIGVLVRGETPHFDYIASEASAGIGQVGREADVPVTFGVLTCETMEQAMARSGSKAGNKGVEAAQAAIEMANLYERMDE